MSSDPSSSNPPSPSQDDDTLRTERLLLYADQSPFATPRPGVQDNTANLSVGSVHAAVAREKGVHAVRDIPLPLWALIPISAVLIIGGSYLGSNIASGPNIKGFDYSLTRPNAGEVQAADPAREFLPDVWLENGKAGYNAACVSCHQANGEGTPGQYPPLKGSEFVINGDRILGAILDHGVSGPLTVNGRSYNGVMPPGGGAPKSNKQLAQIMSYIRNAWGNSASLVYDDQVAEFRKTETARATPYLEAELREIPLDATLPPTKRNAAAGAAPETAPAAPAETTAPGAPGPVESESPAASPPAQ